MVRSITPRNNNGSIRIRFTYQGNRHSLSCGDWSNPKHRSTASLTAAQIVSDIELETFDQTLNKYRNTTNPSPSSSITLLQAWDEWSSQSKSSQTTIETHYKYCRRAIEQCQLPSNISSTIFNRRLRLIKQCIKACDREGKQLSDAEYWRRLTPVTQQTKTIQPFSKEEMLKLLEAVGEHRPNYMNFTTFYLGSGCRIGEVIALQGQSVDSIHNEILIESTMHREPGSYTFVRKSSTKTGTKRVLKSKQLVDLCLNEGELEAGKHVFTTVTGKVIDYTYFRKEVWKHCLSIAGVPYRKLHTARHTMLSNALEAGLTVPQVADIAGHKNSSQIVRTYGHVINKAEIPEF